MINATTVTIKNLTELKKLAKIIHKILKNFNSPIFLNGEIGAGKTTFAKILIKYINPKIYNVSSPTFNIANTYETKFYDKTIWHFDLYRIINSQELHIFDMADILNNQIAIIEWGNKFPELYLYNKDVIVIDINVKNKIREINIYCNNKIISDNLKDDLIK